ncbi:protein NinF [Escherichia coli]|uniref:protein NinF n=1 Tax=Escherichia coli TaxID=562 RepID=UPI0028791C5B|nr:protein NinF [Escherichia coli]MDS1519154.1 protein NinF [Escherichia coli]
MIDPNRSYEQESVERALTCANCGQNLHVLEFHVCERSIYECLNMVEHNEKYKQHRRIKK